MEPVQRTKLTVQFAGNAPQWNPDNLDLPVEVRRLDSAFVGRTLSTGSLDVGPGTYVARAAAEGGEFAGSVEVPPGQAEASVLLRFYDQQSSHQIGTRAADAETSAAKDRQLGSSFELLEGHVLLGHPLVATAAIERDANGLMRASSPAGSTVLRVKSHDGAESLISPIPESVAAHLSWEDATDETGPDVAFHFDHPQAQLLLSYIARSAIADAQLAARSATLTAAQLLRGKKWDPLAGAVGAYVLLSQSEYDVGIATELQSRSEQLWKYNRTFPDAWCIRAECQTRAGEHQSAFDTLLQLNDVGLPFFRAGLSLAGTRLAEYLEPDALPELDEDSCQRATVLLRRLRWLGLHALPAEPILKLANFDPGDAAQYHEFWRSTDG